MKTSNPTNSMVKEVYSKTYSRFNWKSFLEQESFTLRDLNESLMRSGDWVTCALGQACHNTPVATNAAGRPLDRMLNYLGREFHFAIEKMILHFDQSALQTWDFECAHKRAKEVLTMIESRVETLTPAEVKA